jgi:type IV pilus assembly protein PilB
MTLFESPKSAVKPASSPIPKRTPLGELLIAEGLITSEELGAALEFKQERGIKLGQALVALHLVKQSDLANALRAQGKIHCITLTPGIVQPEVAALLGEARSRNLQAIAINRIAGVVTVAMEDPTEIYNVDAISVAINCPVFAVHAELAHVEACIEAVFRRSGPPRPSLGEVIVEPETDRSEVKLELARDEDEPASDKLDDDVIHVVHAVLDEGFAASATDIHFEPRPQGLEVRFRVDGVMSERVCLPKQWMRQIPARLKLIANLDPAERHLPQRGRARAEIRGHKVELSVATTPTLFGEGAVVKLRDIAKRPQDLASIGLAPHELESLRRMVYGRDGLVLAAGPQGSGKTTTLYALLAHLNAPDTKIVTVESPVEMVVEGATQIGINRRAGLSYTRGLRAALRQDPDVVMISELGDPETARTAVEAALVGPLVLTSVSSLATAESVRRLCDLGVPAYHVADALRGVVAQRLVRRICTNCRRAADPRPELFERLGLSPDSGPYFEGRGCAECQNTGFKGRIRLYEILSITSELAAIIRRDGDSGELRALAREQGLVTLREDGILKARAGETTLAEVFATTARG